MTRLLPRTLQTVIALVGDHYDRPAVWASNLLCAAYGHCRAPYTGGSESTPKLLFPANAPAPLSPEAALRLPPNPPSHWEAMSYHLPGYNGTVTLVVRDAGGRVLHQLNAAGEQGQRVWDTRELAPGVYTVELWLDAHMAHTERLILQP